MTVPFFYDAVVTHSARAAGAPPTHHIGYERGITMYKEAKFYVESEYTGSICEGDYDNHQQFMADVETVLESLLENEAPAYYVIT